MSAGGTRRALTLAVVGSLLALLAPGVWLLTRDSGPQTFVVAAPEASPSAPPTSFSAPVETRSALLVDVVRQSDPPVEVTVRGVSAPVDAVGLDSGRQVVVPDDVRRAGWYAPGPEPGSPQGSAVLVGHVDDRRQGLGAFAVLREVQPGDVVAVRTASGAVVLHDVVALEQFSKTEVPLTRLFARTGPAQLVLISCGGDFDAALGQYSDNVVVTAVPRG